MGKAKPATNTEPQGRKSALRNGGNTAKSDPAKQMLKTSAKTAAKSQAAIQSEVLKRAAEAKKREDAKATKEKDDKKVSKAAAKDKKKQKKNEKVGGKTKTAQKKGRKAEDAKKEKAKTAVEAKNKKEKKAEKKEKKEEKNEKKEEKNEEKKEEKKGGKKEQKKERDAKPKADCNKRKDGTDDSTEETKRKLAESMRQKVLETPPPKRVRTKSPGGSSGVASTTASSSQYKADNKKKAEAHFQKIRGSLDSALLEAEDSEDEGNGMLELLDSLGNLSSSAKEADEMEEGEEEAQVSNSEDEEPEDKEEEDTSEEESEGRERSEAEEEDEEEEEERDEENPSQDEADDEDDDDGEESEGEGSGGEDEEVKGKKDSLASAVSGTLKNSKTNKKEWDKFDRQTKSSLKFPPSLQPMLKTKKVELFNMWLENDMSWDRVQCVVERQQTSSNLSRKEWVAVQAKDLKTRLPEDRFNELIKRRTEAGLYYPDEDYPDDDMDWFVESWAQKETWIYMPKGRVVRQDDAAAEILKVRAEKKLDENLFNALTAEEGGVLAAGALPAVKAASASGAQKIMESLNDGAKVVKAPKPKKDKKPDEPVKPKSILEPGSGQDALAAVLDKATKARTKAIQLQGMEFADQLSQQLLNRAGQMEGIYGRLKKSVSAEKPSDKDISAILKEIEAQNKWFEKAEVPGETDPQECEASVLLPH
ncbi:Uncharacterized protein SCF082_LOCUS41130 [Durusdinium trenchii]|uniref:Uncharacterized protein n=1 Tax=Durusdinium trenchii TaxID=1381693 RepID=A0ABP0QH29_9DINO